MTAAHDVTAPRFVYFRKHRWAQCYCARAGSWTFRTLYKTLYGGDYEQPETQTLEELLRLQASGVFVAWFVRHPLVRFMSVYQYFRSKHIRWHRDGIVYPKSSDMREADFDGRLFSSPATFAERAFACFPDDKHIAPQADMFGGIPDFVAPLYRSVEAWERMKPRIRGDVPRDLPVVNSVGSVMMDDVPDSAKRFYAADMEFFKRINADFDSTSIQARRPDVARQARATPEVVRSDALREVPDRDFGSMQR